MNAVLNGLIDKLSNESVLFVYGTGQYGKMILKIMTEFYIDREIYFVETELPKPKRVMSRKVISVEEMNVLTQKYAEYDLLLAVSKKLEPELLKNVVCIPDENVILLTDEERKEILTYGIPQSKEVIVDTKIFNETVKEIKEEQVQILTKVEVLTNKLNNEDLLTIYSRYLDNINNLSLDIRQRVHDMKRLDISAIAKEVAELRAWTVKKEDIFADQSRYLDNINNLSLDIRQRIHDVKLFDISALAKNVTEIKELALKSENSESEHSHSVRNKLNLLENKMFLYQQELVKEIDSINENKKDNDAETTCERAVKVSVLVPVYNTARYLRECLNSIIGQTLYDLEIIIINDGSTDESMKLISEYAQRDSRIKIIDKKNSGYGDSLNQGIKQAQGQYVSIVESDDFVKYNMLEKLYFAAQRKDADVVLGTYHIYHDHSGEVEAVTMNVGCGEVVSNEDKNMLLCQAAAIWRGLYKREFLLENDLMFLNSPGASYQDTSFFFKVVAMAKRLICIPEQLLFYRRDHENASVQDQSKVYCVCDEFAEIRRYLTEKECMVLWEDVYKRAMFKKYYWNYMRLYGEAKEAFYKRFRMEMSGLLGESVDDLKLWTEVEKDILKTIM